MQELWHDEIYYQYESTVVDGEFEEPENVTW